MDHYAVLGVRSDSRAEEIDDQFRMLARLYQSNADDERTERRLSEIREAYDVLSDPSKRLRYDRRREGSVVATAASEPARSSSEFVPEQPKDGAYEMSRRLATYALAVMLLLACLVFAIRHGNDTGSRAGVGAASVTQVSPR
jgi:curved DNA-binding protein CbpA